MLLTVILRPCAWICPGQAYGFCRRFDVPPSVFKDLTHACTEMRFQGYEICHNAFKMGPTCSRVPIIKMVFGVIFLLICGVTAFCVVD